MPGASGPQVTVSVVSGRDPQNLRSFLSSVGGALTSPASVVVVLNSRDSLTADEALSAGATAVIERPEPKGFAVNHNQVIRQFPADYYVIANDDVVLTPRALDRLIEEMVRPGNERVGVVSPRLLNPDGTLQPSTYSFPTIPASLLAVSGLRARLGTGRLAHVLARLARRRAGASRMWEHDTAVDVDTLRGALVVVAHECIDDVGLMPEVSLVGGEETEWHRRMQKKKWRVRFTPSVDVIHVGQSTVGGRKDLEPEYLRGLLNFFICHRSAAASRGLAALAAPIFMSRAAAALARGDKEARRALARCAAVCVSVAATNRLSP